jgi:hypothetical protein
MKKALIKKTGEIFEVQSEYSMMTMQISLPIDLEPKLKELEKSFYETWTNYKIKMKTGKDKEDYYTLSNGETYEFDELIVGLDEIREWKIKNGLNI